MIRDRQAQLDAFVARVFAPAAAPAPARRSRGSPPPACPSDEEVIRRARAARNGAKFARLFDRGDTTGYGGDDSRADQALVSLLAFCTQDPDQLDRIFSRSALCRPKWERRADYRERTIAKALAGGEVYAPPAVPVLGPLRARSARLRIKEVRRA